MAQLPSTIVVEPFGEVNVFQEADGSIRVRTTILMKPSIEGAQTGLAIDGSQSMQKMFGASGVVSALFASTMPNVIEPVARTLASYLANFDTDGETTVIYWACGIGGGEIEEQGDLSATNASTHSFIAPKKFGTGTKLLPAIKYFTETRFSQAQWSIFVFITDGEIEDLDDVESYSIELAKQIAAQKRNFVKLVLIGIGDAVNEGQMEELDDLDYGGLKTQDGDDIDLWDHKLASEMQKLEEIFAEVVSANMILSPSAQINDDAGNPVVPLDRSSYSDGLPALLNFKMPAGAKAFSLTLPGGPTITQPLQ